MRKVLFYSYILLFTIFLFSACTSTPTQSSKGDETNLKPNVTNPTQDETSQSSKGDETNLSDLEHKLISEQKDKENKILSKESIQPYTDLVTKSYPEHFFFKRIAFKKI